MTRKITSTVAAIARGTADRLTLGNLDVRRDWGWAPDYVDAMVRAARAERAGDYVIATGEGHSVRDFVAAAFARAGITDWEPLVGTDPAVRPPRRRHRPRRRPRKARRDLGWSPTVTFAELVAPHGRRRPRPARIAPPVTDSARAPEIGVRDGTGSDAVPIL